MKLDVSAFIRQSSHTIHKGEKKMHMNVKKKLLLSFSAVLILLTILSSISYYQFGSVNTSYSAAIEDRLQKIKLANDIASYAYQEQGAVRGYLITGSDDYLTHFDEKGQQFKETANTLSAITTADEAKKLLAEMIEAENQYQAVSKELIMLKQQNKEATYTKLMVTKGGPIVTHFQEISDQLGALQENLLLEKKDQLSDQAKDTQLFILIISILTILVGLAIALLISKNIATPVVLVSEAVNQIAQGNLAIDKVNVKNNDEIGQLATDFNQMTENLRHLVQQVSQTSEQVAASAEELTASAEQTSSATGQVATSIEGVASNSETLTIHADETATTVSEMATGVQKVADTTSTVAEFALETSKQASKGNEYIIKVIEQMKSIHISSNNTSVVIKELHSRSSQIGQIIEVITGIAEQTNLLALNAAIESARAGEHGRGFAVVADEVKKLAEQSSASANQISELIQAIQTDTVQIVDMMNHEIAEVAEGMTIVEETGNTFSTILKSIDNVNSEMQEVSAISEEMSAGVEQVSASVLEMADIVKSSASNTAEIASASEEQLASMQEVSSAASELAKMSESLSDLIKQFKV